MSVAIVISLIKIDLKQLIKLLKKIRKHFLLSFIMIQKPKKRYIKRDVIAEDQTV